jgi:hypothetical protein
MSDSDFIALFNKANEWGLILLTDVTPPNDISIKIVGYENT